MKRRNLVLSSFDLMDVLAECGWCVVIKRLPPQIGWIIEGSRSEYDVPNPDRQVGHGKWCCEAQWLGEGFRHSEHAMADTPEDAIRKVFFECDKKPEKETA
jgi:hypothetical protein